MLELIRTRRSIRKYTSQPITKKTVDYILKCALLSPSSRSLRPWSYVLVEDPDSLLAMSLCREKGSSFLSGARLAIVIVADPNQCDVWIEDCAIAASNILLAAHSQKLGACWIQIRKRFSADGMPAENIIKNTLHIPDLFKVASIIAIGHPDEHKPAYTDDTYIWNKIHHEHFNQK